uniref:HAD family hydrolase n=1 Tax=OCS116 cluster bacterium TaxID=2030921 RepID=A0A2A4Z2L1_9PROT
MKNYKLIGFDMDGTLCRFVSLFDEVFDQAFAIKKSVVSDVWMAAISANCVRTGIEAVHAIMSNISQTEAQQQLTNFSNLWAQNQRLFDGVVPMLKNLKASGAKLTLITNGPSFMQHAVIDHLGIRDCFDTAFASGDEILGINKPNPACFDRVAQLMNVDAKDCLFIGDGEVNDYQGVQSVGWDALWVKPCNDQSQPKLNDLTASAGQKSPYVMSWS